MSEKNEFESFLTTQDGHERRMFDDSVDYRLFVGLDWHVRRKYVTKGRSYRLTVHRREETPSDDGDGALMLPNTDDDAVLSFSVDRVGNVDFSILFSTDVWQPSQD